MMHENTKAKDKVRINPNTPAVVRFMLINIGIKIVSKKITLVAINVFGLKIF